ncbi:MAG: argininosuccinate synthase [Gemmatimonadales bacterium]
MNAPIVLAYSGGLDTSAIVPWLQENYDAPVLCYTADVGQPREDLLGLELRARRAGATGSVVEDLRDRFVEEVILPTLKAGAVYARSYLLGTAMARPVVAAGQATYAREVGAGALAHGCTGKGNDQVRFELTFQALAPELDVIAPWREWAFKGREDLLAYLERRGIPYEAAPEAAYSRDANLWHCSHEGGVIEDPSQEAPADLYLLTADPAAAPDTGEEVSIGFEEGVPTELDAVPLGPREIIEQLNEVAARHGVGRADVVEDRIVGMKSRGIYETPGGTVLRTAHRELEQLVLDRRTLELKDLLAFRYADLVYEGRWWTEEREALDGLVAVTQRKVTGVVRVRLFKGSVAVLSRRSPFSLHQEEYATFNADAVYDQADAKGFIRLFGLPIRIGGLVGGRAQVPSEMT